MSLAIQGSASDIVKRQLLTLRNAMIIQLNYFRMVNFKHDEVKIIKKNIERYLYKVILIVKNEDIEEAKDILKKKFGCNIGGINFPIKITVSNHHP